MIAAAVSRTSASTFSADPDTPGAPDATAPAVSRVTGVGGVGDAPGTLMTMAIVAPEPTVLVRGRPGNSQFQ